MGLTSAAAPLCAASISHPPVFRGLALWFLREAVLGSWRRPGPAPGVVSSAKAVDRWLVMIHTRAAGASKLGWVRQ